MVCLEEEPGRQGEFGQLAHWTLQCITAAGPTPAAR
jgi:hypothetical protein